MVQAKRIQPSFKNLNQKQSSFRIFANMQFKDVIGQEKLKARLIDNIKTERIHHAQLFLGDSGHGSLALAMAYAQYINCENRTDTDSCGVCSNCQQNYKLIHPDVHFSFTIVETKSTGPEGGDTNANFDAQGRDLMQRHEQPDDDERMSTIAKGN